MADDFENEFVGRMSPTESLLWDPFDSQISADDQTAAALFHAGYFDQTYSTDERVAIRQAFSDYLADEYGIDFDEQFDWETWRESYGEAA